MGKSKRNSGPKPNSRRAELTAQRRAEREALAATPTRPFEGLAFECDLVAMREFVASATAPLPLTDGDRPTTIATVLPGAVGALVRDDEARHAFVAMQVQTFSADLSADVAASVEWTRTAEPGTSLPASSPSEETPALRDLVVADTPLEITVHKDFSWWVPEGVEPDAEVAATIERANGAILPSARLSADGVSAAWWVDAGDKAHIRWVRPEDEDALMIALARLSARGDLHVGEGSRFAGSFRTHGLLVPVFDLDPERHPDEWAEATAELGRRLDETLADTSDLTPDQRRARDGLRSRQVTLR
ncbi:DUF5926 family protein [Rhodococcoides corynebacterioides]|uniref:DUF5926 family protein n=1 Tax=Rhodococcoides corynebacterioides TaxID=53972 RepID=UPI001C9B2AB7|nr:DUF5926 family protein [Rhodococcus corynebacterioides]MBY6351872.1 hypothetical protein [Rhodococcus corynebacterioides]MBY6364476.1 hypothetical protein [Rhodococcus corynebacterioides]